MLDTDIKVDLKKAFIGGALASAIGLAGMWITGHASGTTTDHLLRDFIPSAQALTGTIILASATILALMFTILGLGSGESHLKKAYYIRIRQIALGDTFVFVAAMILRLLLNIPINESSKMEQGLEGIVYYAALGLSALLGGALIAIVLMIYSAVSDTIDVLALDKEDHDLYDAEGEDGSATAEDETERQETSDA